MSVMSEISLNKLDTLSSSHASRTGKKVVRTGMTGKVKRRPGLKPLQPCAKNEKLVGNKRENFFTPKKSQKRKHDDENHKESTPQKVAKIIKPKPTSEVKIYEDPKPEAKSKQENTDIDEEAYELMVKDTVPEAYWEEIAEQRRVALVDALDENEKLHKQVEGLKEENRRLSAVADQAEYFASIVKMLTGNDEADDDDKDDENDQEVKSEDQVFDEVDGV